MLARMWRNRNVFTLQWECKLAQRLQKTVCRFFKEVELELTYNAMVQLQGTQPKKHKTGYSKVTCTLVFIAALFTIAKLWKQT
jgi:hypothetical protein